MGQLEALAVAIETNVPAMLVGDPGTGKSAFVEEMVARRGGWMYLFLTAQRDPSDLTGAMHPAMRGDVPVTRYSAPEWVVEANERAESGQFVVIFFDEFSTASPNKQAGVLTLLQSRKAGEYRLHPDIRFVLAANPVESAAGGYDLAPPTANRLWWLDWVQQADAWADGIISGWPVPPELLVSQTIVNDRFNGDVMPLVAAYVKNSGMLNNMPSNESEAGKAWPSGRTWEMAGKLMATAQIAGMDENTISLLILGAVGPTVAGEYLSYVQNLDLPDPEELIKNPDKFEIPQRQDQLFAILGQVVAHVKQNLTDKRNQAAWTILSKVASEGSVDLAAAHARTLATAAVGAKVKLSSYHTQIKPFIPLLENAGLIPKAE